jgi:hypothetical protein
MAQASPADKDIQPGTGPSGLSGPHHYLSPLLAEIPPVTRRQVEQMKKQAPPPVEPLSLMLGLVLGVVIGVIIWEGRDRR